MASSRCTTSRCGCRRRVHGLDEWHGRVGFRTVAARHHARRARHAVHAARQRPAGVRAGRQLDSRRLFPVAGRPASCTRERLTQARDANVNLIRVWGGGIYESEDFYDLCDELGLLVWQDFLFACAAYSEEEPLRSEVVAEAREAVTRLSPHPSLALWNGGNENVWGYHDWGWQEELDGRSWGWRVLHRDPPGIVARTRPDPALRPQARPTPPTRRCIPTIPTTAPCTSGTSGTSSTTPDYRDHTPRFASEFGFQGPPALGHADPRRPRPSRCASDSPAMLVASEG